MSKHKIIAALQLGGALLVSIAVGLLVAGLTGGAILVSVAASLLVAGVFALVFGIALERESMPPVPVEPAPEVDA